MEAKEKAPGVLKKYFDKVSIVELGLYRVREIVRSSKGAIFTALF
jgi:hypothetical protein